MRYLSEELSISSFTDQESENIPSLLSPFSVYQKSCKFHHLLIRKVRTSSLTLGYMEASSLHSRKASYEDQPTYEQSRQHFSIICFESPRSWLFFHLHGLDTQWLSLPVKQWLTDNSYCLFESNDFVLPIDNMIQPRE